MDQNVLCHNDPYANIDGGTSIVQEHEENEEMDHDIDASTMEIHFSTEEQYTHEDNTPLGDNESVMMTKQGLILETFHTMFLIEAREVYCQFYMIFLLYKGYILQCGLYYIPKLHCMIQAH